ncbi:S-layer homology domain-containing protein [Rossellomorea oryzaecorticis]|uniref:S-layer homology domain-containing protein n=1 Tax=Rossellomorea oryzaecorticis TaxID=1396505 RepID=A0ABW8VLT9_9BACI
MKNIIRVIMISALFLGMGVSSASAQDFTDVNQDYRFYDYIMHLSGNNVINGYSDGKFKPGNNISRGDAAVMVGRILDFSKETQETPFPDVSKSNPASGYIKTAAEKGIINGYPTGKFEPYKNITRGEMALIMSRAFELSKEEINPFVDVSIQNRSYIAIRQLYASGITQGNGKGNFFPDNPISRGEFSAFLARATVDEYRLPVYPCGYNPESKTNPDNQTVNCLITNAALESDTVVPPEVVKSIASIESGWRQFDDNGEPLESDDNADVKGYGIMQITTHDFELDEQKVKNNLLYNLESGIKILADKYKNSPIPTIGDKDPMNLENWYFAIMAYNGTVAQNSPFYKATGDNNFDAYQMKVYANMNANGFVDPQIFDIPMNVDDFHYGEDTNWDIIFKKDHYNFYSDYTPSKHYFNTDDLVVHVGSTLRAKPSTKSAGTALDSAEKLKILGAPVYDSDPRSTNQFVWYPVEVVRTGHKGFVASYNVRQLP